MIDVPQDVLTFRTQITFVPLNSTEIAILGGQDQTAKFLGDVITLNTITNEFKREVEEEGAFSFVTYCSANESVKVR